MFKTGLLYTLLLFLGGITMQKKIGLFVVMLTTIVGMRGAGEWSEVERSAKSFFGGAGSQNPNLAMLGAKWKNATSAAIAPGSAEAVALEARRRRLQNTVDNDATHGTGAGSTKRPGRHASRRQAKKVTFVDVPTTSSSSSSSSTSTPPAPDSPPVLLEIPSAPPLTPAAGLVADRAFSPIGAPFTSSSSSTSVTLPAIALTAELLAATSPATAPTLTTTSSSSSDTSPRHHGSLSTPRKLSFSGSLQLGPDDTSTISSSVNTSSPLHRLTRGDTQPALWNIKVATEDGPGKGSDSDAATPTVNHGSDKPHVVTGFGSQPGHDNRRETASTPPARPATPTSSLARPATPPARPTTPSRSSGYQITATHAAAGVGLLVAGVAIWKREYCKQKCRDLVQWCQSWKTTKTNSVA